MSNLGKNIAVAVAFAASALLVSGCELGKSTPSTVLDISGPPLAQTLGCKEQGSWRLRVIANADRDNPTLTPDQKQKRAKTVCTDAVTAKKYTVGQAYP